MALLSSSRRCGSRDGLDADLTRSCKRTSPCVRRQCRRAAWMENEARYAAQRRFGNST